MKTYFAHSKLIYNTPEEETLLEVIRSDPERFGEVIDPNKDMGELGSITPYLEMVEKCDTVVVHEHTGYVGRGAYAEVERALKLNKPVFAIRDGEFFPVMGVSVFNEKDWKVQYGQLITELKQETNETVFCQIEQI